MPQPKWPRLVLIRLLGRLAAKIDADPRPTVEVIDEHFLFTDQEREIFLRSYNDKGDPINADIR